MAKVTLKPSYQTIDGVLLPKFPPHHVREIFNYEPKPDDVFIATYPKCGTTWMQSIVLHIFRKGKELENVNDFHKYIPFIENAGLKGIENMPRPGAMKSHLPFTHIPYSPDAKYIYVLRNPKDCCVSMYYHTVRAPGNCYAEGTFDDFFELFMTGEVEYNDYFDHMMSWYPHRHDKNVLFTTYEQMKEDPVTVVHKVASFLGKEYIEAIQQDNTVLNNILRCSGFDYMKQHLSELYRHRRKQNKPKNQDVTEDNEPPSSHVTTEKDEPVVEQPEIKEKVGFFRKGVSGDWRNHFSEEQNERMNQKFIEKTRGTEIYDMYKPYVLV